MMIDINKKYLIRDGREVRLYAVDGGVEGNMVHGAIKYKDGWWGQCAWQKDGAFNEGQRISELDLIEVRPRHKRTVWLNVYADNTKSVYGTKERADCDKHLRIACIKVELDFAEGDGL